MQNNKAEPCLSPIEIIERETSRWYPAMYRTSYGAPTTEPRAGLDIRGMSFGDFCSIARLLTSEQRADLVRRLTEVDEPAAPDAVEDITACIQ